MMHVMQTIAFARGVPAPDMLPVDALRDAVISGFDADPVGVLSYGKGGGYEPLRGWLAEQHSVDPSQIVISTGSLQGFILLADILRERAEREGRRPVVVVENPTYDRPLLVLQRTGWDVRSARMDGEGVIPQELESAVAGGVDLIYLIPNFQNPGGSTLSEERRAAVLDLAASAGALVFEDDPYGELWFASPPPPSLLSRAGSDQVVYSSSFSKTISPGLRVGYLVLPSSLAGPVETRANDTYISPTFIGQAAVLHYARSGALERGIADSRTKLRERCDLLTQAIDAHLPDATYHRPSGGYFLWLTLPGNVLADDLVAPAAQLGVSFVAGSAFGEGNEHALRLAFSSPPIDLVATGIERLSEACLQLT